MMVNAGECPKFLRWGHAEAISESRGVLTAALATRMGYPCGWERCCNSGHRLPGCSDPVGEGATALAVDAITRQLEGFDAQGSVLLEE